MRKYNASTALRIFRIYEGGANLHSVGQSLLRKLWRGGVAEGRYPSYNPHCSSISCCVEVKTMTALSKPRSSASTRLLILYVFSISARLMVPARRHCSIDVEILFSGLRADMISPPYWQHTEGRKKQVLPRYDLDLSLILKVKSLMWSMGRSWKSEVLYTAFSTPDAVNASTGPVALWRA